jgi:hypothetical protein
LAILIQEAHYHIGSNQAAKNLGQRCEQRFHRRRDRRNPMDGDTCDNAVQTDAGFFDSTYVGQRRMLRLSPRVRTFEKSVTTVVA